MVIIMMNHASREVQSQSRTMQSHSAAMEEEPACAKQQARTRKRQRVGSWYNFLAAGHEEAMLTMSYARALIEDSPSKSQSKTNRLTNVQSCSVQTLSSDQTSDSLTSASSGPWTVNNRQRAMSRHMHITMSPASPTCHSIQPSPAQAQSDCPCAN